MYTGNKRVVITGMGAVSPFGLGVKKFWDALLKNQNGISSLDPIVFHDEIVGIGARLPIIDQEVFKQLDSKVNNRKPEDPDVIKYFLAVHEAVCQSGLEFNEMDEPGLEKIGTFIADRQMNPIRYIERYGPYIKAALDDENNFLDSRFNELLEKTPLISFNEFNESCNVSHFTARVYGIRGTYLNIANACASSNNAIEEGCERIKSGDIDVAIAGGAFCLDLAGMIGFSRIGALSRNPDPDAACRPFDAERDGFIMGSGCGILILEELEHAKRRGAEILCEIAGYATAIDAFRATDPDPNASSAVKAIQKSMKMAKVAPGDIDYINAHGTSTQLNDLSETRAIKTVMGDDAYHIPVSSTKSMIGHSILTAAAFEAIVCINSIKDGVIHGTRNWRNRDPELDLDYVPETARGVQVTHALSNSFGFGGINTSVIFKAFDN